jgi:hypothetical protein
MEDQRDGSVYEDPEEYFWEDEEGQEGGVKPRPVPKPVSASNQTSGFPLII